MEKEPDSGGKDDVADEGGASSELGIVDQRGQEGLLADHLSLQHALASEVAVVESAESSGGAGQATCNGGTAQVKKATGSNKRKKGDGGKVPKAGKQCLYYMKIIAGAATSNNIMLAKICRMFWLKMFLSLLW